MLAVKIIAAVLLFLLAGGIVTGYFVMRAGCLGSRKEPVAVGTPDRPRFVDGINEGRQWFFSALPEEVEILSHDNLRLHGYYLPGSTNNTLIVMHGYHSAPAHDTAPMLRFYHELGFNLLLPDQRAHGKSEGKYLTFGVLESRDVCRWIDFLNERGRPDNIFLTGSSMGGATVCMASLLELPDNVRGIIADCPFGNPTELYSYTMSFRTRVPARPVLYFCSIWTRILSGWKYNDVVYSDYARARLPLLILHGDKDRTVPHYMSEKLFRHYGGEKQYELFPDCAHVYAYLKDPPRYERAVRDFISKHSK